MRTEQEIQKKYEQVTREGNLADSLDDRLMIHSELKILEWILRDSDGGAAEQ